MPSAIAANFLYRFFWQYWLLKLAHSKNRNSCKKDWKIKTKQKHTKPKMRKKHTNQGDDFNSKISLKNKSHSLCATIMTLYNIVTITTYITIRMSHIPIHHQNLVWKKMFYLVRLARINITSMMKVSKFIYIKLIHLLTVALLNC